VRQVPFSNSVGEGDLGGEAENQGSLMFERDITPRFLPLFFSVCSVTSVVNWAFPGTWNVSRPNNSG
jgi:hypothetical protein